MSKDRRATRTKSLITDSFTGLLYELPFDKITIKKITEVAGVNRATFYLHFQDKYDLMELIISENMRVNLSAHLDNLSDLTYESHLSIFNVVSSYCETNLNQDRYTCKNTQILFESYTEKGIKDCLINLFTRLLKNQNKSNSKPLEDLNVTALLLTWSYYGVISDLSKKKCTASDTLFDSMYRYICLIR